MKNDLKWEELQKIVKVINNDSAVNTFFDLYKRIVEHFDLNNSDEVLYSAIRLDKKRIHLTIGASYIVAIEKKGKNTVIGCCVKKKDIAKLKEIYNEKIVISPLPLW